jgi:SagB-type dehydrogenase family enzyme
MSPKRGTIPLPRPLFKGRISVEEALARRRSVREFTSEELSLQEVSQLLWATQGVTDPEGLRTAPSAGALYPLEIDIALPDGVFQYEPQSHSLIGLADHDRRPALAVAAMDQTVVATAPATFVLAAVFSRTTAKYGREDGPRFVQFEIGHAAQNLLLQAVALGLGAVAIGAFEEEPTRKALSLTRGHRPLYLVSVGRR